MTGGAKRRREGMSRMLVGDRHRRAVRSQGDCNAGVMVPRGEAVRKDRIASVKDFASPPVCSPSTIRGEVRSSRKRTHRGRVAYREARSDGRHEAGAMISLPGPKADLSQQTVAASGSLAVFDPLDRAGESSRSVGRM